MPSWAAAGPASRLRAVESRWRWMSSRRIDGGEIWTIFKKPVPMRSSMQVFTRTTAIMRNFGLCGANGDFTVTTGVCEQVTPHNLESGGGST